MNLKKILIVLLLLAGAGVIILFSIYLIKPKSTNPPVSITSHINDITYKKNDQVKLPLVDQLLLENNLQQFSQEIIVNHDLNHITHRYLGKNKTILSGSSFSIIDEKIIVTIYLNPDLSEEDILFEINQNYLIGLLRAIESSKQTSTYNPEYLKVSTAAHKLMMELADKNQYPISSSQ